LSSVAGAGTAARNRPPAASNASMFLMCLMAAFVNANLDAVDIVAATGRER
jgi:hypothetical protein